MRIQRILVGAALLMLCAAAAYAQVGISSTPVSQVIASGKAEVAGAVRVTAQAPVVADTFTIRYGGLDIANPDDIQIINGGWDVAPSISEVEDGVITLVVPATAAIGDYFEVRNVRIDISDLSGPASVSAQLGALNNTIVAGQSFAIVINTIGAGLVAGAEDDDDAPATILANGNVLDSSSVWVLTEGFSSAWKNVVQAGPLATNGVEITLTMDELPEGLEMCVQGIEMDGGGSVGVDGDDCFNEDNDQVVITFSDTNQSEINELVITFTATADEDEVPYDSATYRIRATLSPTDDDDLYPWFEEVNLPTAGFPGLIIVPSTTNFILPYLISDTAMGYNTGIAIANTTKDPFGDNGAIVQDGSVIVTFYGNDGTTVVYNSATDAVKGSGLNSAGVLRSGYTWTVLASELLAAKGRTTPLTGYAIIVLNATNGHGNAFISNFAGFTSGSGLIVIEPPAVEDRIVDTEWTTF